jgi:hypothetical protein
VQHEGEPLGWRERVQHDQQGQADRVGQHRLVLRAAGVLRTEDGVGHVHAERHLVARPPGAQHVEADPGDDGGEPRADVVHAAGVGAAEPERGVLHGVVSVAERAEHPVGHRPQPRAVLLEALGEPRALVHPVTFLRPAVSLQ